MNILVVYADEFLASQWLGRLLDSHTEDRETVSLFSANIYPATAGGGVFTTDASSNFNYYDYRQYRNDSGINFDRVTLVSSDEFASLPDSEWVRAIPERSVALVQSSTQINPAWEATKYERTMAIEEGFEWDGAIYQTDPVSVSLISGRVAKVLAKRSLGEELADFVWRSKDDVNHTFTPNQFLRFAIALDDFVEAQYVASWGKKARL